MPQILNREKFAKNLRGTISSVAKSCEQRVGVFEENLSDEIQIPLRTLKSWTTPSSVPQSIEDSKLFSLLWSLAEKGSDKSHIDNILFYTSIPTPKHMGDDWFIALFEQAEIYVDGKPQPPEKERIAKVVGALFNNDVALPTADDQHELSYLIPLKSSIPFNQNIDLSSLVGIENLATQIADDINHSDLIYTYSLEGQGGIGKTALAHLIVSKLRKSTQFRFIIWIMFGSFFQLSTRRLQNADSTNELLSELGRILDIKDQDMLKSVVKSERYFIVVDNIETEMEAESLSSALSKLTDGESRFLITSRVSLKRFISSVKPTEISPLSPEKIYELLIKLLSPMHVTHEDSARIYDVVGGIPLAIHLLARLLPTQESLESLLSQIRTEKRKAKTSQESIELMFEYIYGRIWNLLSWQAKKLLVQIALYVPIGGTNWKTLTTLFSNSQEDLSPVIEELLKYYLLNVSGSVSKKLYTVHPLTKNYIRSVANVD